MFIEEIHIDSEQELYEVLDILWEQCYKNLRNDSSACSIIENAKESLMLSWKIRTEKNWNKIKKEREERNG